MFISPVTTLLCSPHYHTHTASLACTLQDEDVLHLTLTGLVGGLQHADVDERIDKDISELNKTIEEVQAQFRRISVDVFDHAWFTDRRLLVLRPEWEQLLNRFDNFVCHSRRTAQSAAEFLRSYNSTMLDNVHKEDIPRLKREIKSFLPRVASMKAEADANRDSISSIGFDVGTFRAKFESYVKQAEHGLLRDIEDAERRIRQLISELVQLEEQINALYAAIAQAERNASTAGFFGLLFLSPAAAAVAFGFALDAVNKKRQVQELTRTHSEKTSDRNYWHARLNELLQRQETLRKFQAPMSTMDKDMQALITKLEVISNIWSYIESDVSKFETELDLASQTRRPAGFKKALEVVSESYKKLVHILELYAAEGRGGSGGEGPNGGSRTRWRTLDGYDIAW